MTSPERSRPFLTLVTRCCHRPKMLGDAIESALNQTDRDLEIIFIPDKEKRGVHWANCQFERHIDRVDGQYVYTLDDDSVLLPANLVEFLKREAEALHNPGVLMVRSSRPQMAPRILPKKSVWGRREALKLTSTNGGCYISRADWWRMYAHKYCTPAAGDWAYLKALRDNSNVTFVWLDIIAKQTQQLGRGRKFESCSDKWFEEVVKMYGIEQVGINDWRLRPWMGVSPPVVERVAEVPAIPLPVAAAPVEGCPCSKTSKPPPTDAEVKALLVEEAKRPVRPKTAPAHKPRHNGRTHTLRRTPR